jgi:hypothetical protein
MLGKLTFSHLISRCISKLDCLLFPLNVNALWRVTISFLFGSRYHSFFSYESVKSEVLLFGQRISVIERTNEVVATDYTRFTDKIIASLPSNAARLYGRASVESPVLGGHCLHHSIMHIGSERWQRNISKTGKVQRSHLN